MGSDTFVVGAQASPRQRPRAQSVLFGAGIGNALEWYDFACYAIFAPFFAPQFFNPSDKTAALLSSLAVFAVGFLLRPLGGFYFGKLADRRGRRLAMVVSMCLTALGCLLIGCAPTYAAVGVVGPAVLVLGRLLQGFGLGGEIGASFTFLVESAPPNRRGLWASSMFVALIMGSLLATAVALTLTYAVSKGQMELWGWRVPFVLGALLGVYAIFLRRELEEPAAFKESEKHAAGDPGSTWRAIWGCRRQVAVIIGLTAGPTVSYNTWVSGATSYAINFKAMPAHDALWGFSIACGLYIVAQPLWGAFSDRVGRKPNLLLGTGLAVLLAFPAVGLIQGAFWQFTLVVSVSMVALSAWTSIAPAVYAELFPTHIRATGMAIPYSLTVAVFGGTAPYLQSWLASLDRMEVFAAYLALLNFGSLAAALVTPETRGRPLE